MVPASALLNADEGGQKVMVVTSDSVAHERKVAVGVRQGDARADSQRRCRQGEQVVTSGGLGLDDKAKVAIQQPKSEDDDDDDAGGDDAKPDELRPRTPKARTPRARRNERS